MVSLRSVVHYEPCLRRCLETATDEHDGQRQTPGANNGRGSRDIGYGQVDRELRIEPVTDVERDEIVALYAVSDNATICYRQDVLVRPDEQGSGVGRALVQVVLDRYRAVRQKVLLSDDEPGQRPATRHEPTSRGGDCLCGVAR